HTRFSRDWSSDVCSSDLVGHQRRPKSRSDEVRGWYEQFGPALVAYASSVLGDRGRAEDALQQVFLKLLKGNIEVPSPAKPYLFRSEERRVGKGCRSRRTP